ncbi:DNA-3-methyladenine glycosylase [Clostridium sp. 19966]|uniref:DNA-3-methyladenine glycosylase n=1 Tax=Clostridium sp. 19966 TaxID=2768166 RepID=UPI0028DD55E4|nr:DNA-3-methyladenine glycosylase [Clostridium sp. 19966]MDT8717804.1 DNA-3-methyladenine glycosylase [Clostridium sp. 19966]
MDKLVRNFFERDTIVVAKELLGKILVHEVDGKKIAGKIVETEAYLGIEDKAAHSYGGRRTKRVEVMYGEAGFSYVFVIYGMHFCFNVVTREKGVPQAVLIRALEPCYGIDSICHNRFKKPYEKLTKTQIKNLTNGPGKLCSALSISKSLNGEDLCGETLYIEEGNNAFEIVTSKRIGIDYAEEYKDKPWRFYIKDNANVSVK